MRFLIVYGPTREPLDPVRYISNYSTGVMGRHLVEAASLRGHRVKKIECPSDAETALDLLKQMKKQMPKIDVLVMAAAVCDARPAFYSSGKIKKRNLSAIPLVKNPDLLVELAKVKKKTHIFVGFALESEDIFKNAKEKLLKKNLEMIVLQRVTSNQTPFGNRPIDAFLLDADQSMQAFKKVSKKRLAGLIIRESERLHKSRD